MKPLTVSQLAEQRAAGISMDLLDALLSTSNQAEAAKAFTKHLAHAFDVKRGLIPGTINGLTTVLVPVILRGLAALPSESCKEDQKAIDLMADVCAADDGSVVADTLADLILSSSGKADAAHGLAVALLPMVRPDLFAGHAEKEGR